MRKPIKSTQQDGAGLKPEAPKILRQLEWFRLHWRQYWKLILVGVLTVILGWAWARFDVLDLLLPPGPDDVIDLEKIPDE